MWVRLPRDIKSISRLVNDPSLSRSYYPAEKRKPKLHVYMDLLLWWLRYREVNSYYYLYGLDRAHGVDAGEYLPYNLFRNIRDRRNQHLGGNFDYSYVCLLRDKFVFAQFASSLGVPTPRNLACCTRSAITWFGQKREVSLESVLQDHNTEIAAFYKSLTGMGGTEVFPLRISDGKIFVDGHETTLEQLKAKLDGVYLVAAADPTASKNERLASSVDQLYSPGHVQ